MPQKGKAQRVRCGTALEPVSDVYDFDQQDASHISSIKLQSDKVPVTVEFRSPLRIKRDTRVSRKHAAENKMYSTGAVIEASQSGKTSTPCAITGHRKTKCQTMMPGTPCPWVVLHRVPPNSHAEYAVSPIAVEHDLPNDLSRQVDVNSMFDDSSSVMDDSAVGSDWNNKISAGSLDKVPSNPHCVIEDSNPESVSQEYNTDKHKSDTDSGFPKFDSQCEFISLFAEDNIETTKERSKDKADDLHDVHLPMSQSIIDSGQDRHSSTKNQAVNKCMLKTSSENRSSDSDCEVIVYKPGTLDPAKFNSARNTSKFTTKRRHQVPVCDDVEPSDKSDSSNTGASSDINSESAVAKNSVREKLNQSVEHATSPSCKPTSMLRTRITAMDSNSSPTLSACHPSSVKDKKKAGRKAESAEMPSGKPLHVKKPGSTADVLEKLKSQRRPFKKENTKNGLRKRKDVQMAEVEEVCAYGPESQSENADCKYSCTTFTDVV